MLTEATIGIVILIAALFFGVPYRQAYQRRKELERKIRERRQRAFKEDAV